ncbi:P2RX3 protein, partial [Polypterus senegalus]|nr:P2RX3 protein [Polypterus senegalus]
MMECIANFFTYETTKSVVVKSWTIGIINRVVQLLIIAYFVGWVFLHEKAYQTRDTAIESSVMTKVKGFGVYNNRVMDVADYVTPAQSETKYSCNSDDDCKRFMLKTSGNGGTFYQILQRNTLGPVYLIPGQTSIVPSLGWVMLFDLLDRTSKHWLIGYAKYFKKADGTEHRTLLKAHAIRIDVLVYGNVSATICFKESRTCSMHSMHSQSQNCLLFIWSRKTLKATRLAS